MNPVMIDLGFFQVRWYSFFILLGCVSAYIISILRVKKLKVTKTELTDLMFYIMIFGIIGARIYYCIFNFSYYKHNLIDMLKIWEGGLAIHGGIIAGIITIYIFCKKKNISFLEILDTFAPALAIGQAFGRWGNFFNQEAFGAITTEAHLKSLHIPQFIIDGMYIRYDYHIPTFFFESLGCLFIFLIIMLIRNKKNIKKGQITGIYFILYGVLRFCIESTRTDSLMLFNLKMAQVVSILMFLVGMVLILLPIFRRKHDK